MKEETNVFQKTLINSLLEHDNNIAIKISGAEITFDELNKKSNAIANQLINSGLQKETLVVICFKNILDAIYSIVGIIKAGGVFVPIDASLPMNRIKSMMKTIDADYLISDNSIFLDVKDFKNSIKIDKDFYKTISNEFKSEIDYHPEDKMYIYFTSGSTGIPKPILGINKSLNQFIKWEIGEFGFDKSYKFSQFISIGFDAFLRDLFVPICSGATLFIPDTKETLMNDVELKKWMNENKISVIHCVPSLWKVLKRDANKDDFENLKFILMSGEIIHSNDLEEWFSVFGDRVQLVNMYGCTETTMIKTFHYITIADLEKERIPVGKAISGARIIILDGEMNPLEHGNFGDVYIRTPYRTYGYYNDELSTNEKFIKNPFVDNKNDLLYKTGDIGRLSEEGVLDLLGRSDRQVKIRGNRVELQEIENTVLKHDLVRDAVVKEIKSDDGEDSVLSLYFTSNITSNAKKSEQENLNYNLSIPEYLEKIEKYDSEQIAIESKNISLTYKDLSNYSETISNILLENYDDRFALSDHEKERYMRQILLDDWGVASQEKLKRTKIFVGGVGGSAPFILQMALVGVGEIVICDFDEVELSNLNRQFLHNDSRIGMSKAISGKMTLDNVNPNVKIIAHDLKITFDNVDELVGDADIIIDYVDNLDAKFALSECAARKGIPHVISSMIDYNSYAAIFNPPGTACLNCIYDRKVIEEINSLDKLEGNRKKQSLSVHCSSMALTASFIANEVIKIILGFENPIINKYVLFSPKNYSNLVLSRGFQLVTYVFNNHFRNISIEQGVDWDNGWDSSYYQEIELTPDPNCPICGGPNKQEIITKRDQKERTLLQSIEKEKQIIRAYNNNDSKKSKVVTLLFNDDPMLMPCIIGAHKAGMNYLIVEKDANSDFIENALIKSNTRVILTNKSMYDYAVSLGDKVNKNIKIIEINDSLEHIKNKEKINFMEKQSEIQFMDADGLLLSYNLKDFLNGIKKPIKLATGIRELYCTLLQGYTYDFSSIQNDEYTLQTELRSYLTEQLPEYMIPSYLVELDKIPLLPNGKINYNDLPKPDAFINKEFITPKNEIEKRLVEIWSYALKLGIEKISTNANFFQLGGHSLKATIVISKINKELRKKITLLDIYKTGTIEKLAKVLETSDNIDYAEIKPVLQKDSYTILPSQLKLYALQENEPDNITYNMPWVYNIQGVIDKQRIYMSFKQVIDRHESFRTYFVNENNTIVQKIAAEINLEIKYFNEKEHIVDNIDNFIKPFSLEKPPLLNITIIQKCDNKSILIIDMHHIISDGLSQKIFIRDFFELYKGNKLNSLPIQPKDYAEWYKVEKGSGRIEHQEKYWLEVLNRPIPQLKLPYDYERPKVKSNQGKRIDGMFSLPKETKETIESIAMETNTSLFAVLLSIYYVFLSKLSMQEDIIVGTPVEGRTHDSLENLIGMFVNTLALRNSPKNEYVISNFIREVHSNTLQAFENQDYQLDDLISKLKIERNPSRSPLFDTLFVLQNMDIRSNELSTYEIEGICFSEYGYERITSKFDLTFMCTEIKDELVFTVEYCTKIFKDETIGRFANYYIEIVDQVINNKYIKINDIKLTNNLEDSIIDENIQDYNNFSF